MLTIHPKIDTSLCMKGNIRTKQECPKCKTKFQPADPKRASALLCPECHTEPSRLYVDFPWKGGRITVFTDADGHPVDSNERALRILGRMRSEVDNHTFDPANYKKSINEPYHLNAYIRKWLKRKKKRVYAGSLSYSTHEKYRHLAETYIIPYFNSEDIRDIGTIGVNEFEDHLLEVTVRGGKLMSVKYRQDILGTLKTMYHDGQRSGELTRAKVPVFPVFEETGGYWDVLEEEDQYIILSYIPPHDYPIYHFIIWYGIRPSEARAIQRDAISKDLSKATIKRTFSRNNRLRAYPKEKKWRRIPLEEETREILRDLLESQPKSFTGYVFLNRQGRHYSQSYLNDVWNKAVKAAGYPPISLYNASRHSLGTKLADEGESPEMIAEVLGHTDTKSTKKYARYGTRALKPFFRRRTIAKSKIVTKSLPMKK